MPSTIKILPLQLANKIAAGEVVGRPASVVKELLENSLDARATKITIIVNDGGKTSIRVVDDGIGMSSEDAILSFERHATSKIESYEDLENVRTLGFRGEALASISAVAQVEMRTRQVKSEIGTVVRNAGGVMAESFPEACPVGTSVVVKNLFYNTPGRRNFLKSTNTEFKHIHDVIQRIALSHPDVALSFISENETILQVSPADMVERFKDVFGEKLSQTIFSLESGRDDITVRGLLGKPSFGRSSRSEQYVYLNNRYIISRSINRAVFQAYEHLLEKGSFPMFVLFLALDPRKVDVNVHPSKMEVKFEDESSIYRFILSSVRKALTEHDLVPAVHLREDAVQSEDVGLRFHQQESQGRMFHWRDLLKTDAALEHPPLSQTDHGKDPLLIRTGVPSREHEGTDVLASSTSTASPGETEKRKEDGERANEASSRRVWQLHNKYIIVPTAEGMMVVDQHAAHERVLYERTIGRFEASHAQSQQLLFPHTMEMPSSDVALVRELQPHLEALGFSLKLFGSTTIIVDGVPLDVKPGRESTILQQVLDLYKEDDHSVRLEPRERLAKSYSCKAAIKAGDPLNEPEICSLLDQLFLTDIPFVCPHGRPVIVKLSLTELDRRFGRTS